MRTVVEVSDWCIEAMRAFGDPAVPVCQLLCRWVDNFAAYRGDEVVCGVAGRQVMLKLIPGVVLPLPIVAGEEKVRLSGDLETFGSDRVAPGVWVLKPSLNSPGIIHAFVVLYGVPDPAPWEKRIVLLESIA